MTELAYLADVTSAYVREFRARVVARPPGGIVLDRTYFYPTGGGQPNDLGTLGPVNGAVLEIVDVTKSGTAVVHRWGRTSDRAATLAVGSEVEGRIDWARRHTHMRLHTAQHLVSARVFSVTGLRTRRAVLGGRRARIELEGPLGPEVRDQLAQEVGEAVAGGHAVRVRFLPRVEWDRAPIAGRSGLVPLPPHVDPVRVIEIENYDLCPCGGTHVRSTAEIGPLTFERPGPDAHGGERLDLTLAEAAPPTPGE